MAIQMGDRLKSERDYYDEMVSILNQVDPKLGSQTYLVGSTLDTMLRAFSRMMYDTQIDYHNLLMGVVKAPYIPKLESEPFMRTDESGKTTVNCDGNCIWEEKFLFSTTYSKCKNCGAEK